MEDKNIRINLQIKQLNQSNILGYDERYISGSSNYNFALLDNAYKDTGRVYAKLKTSIQNNDCIEPGCKQETEALKNLMNAPQMSLDFLANLTSQLTVTDDNYYDVNQDYRYILFFGLIRDYKGLDLLLEAFSANEIREKNIKLIIAGEYYSDKAPYKKLIEKYKLEQNIIQVEQFIPDSEIHLYFNACDLIVQPYKSATQSGVTQIAYHFNKPMIVTNVGGLKDMCPDGKVGYVVSPHADEIKKAILKFFNETNINEMIENINQIKELYSWSIFTKKLLALTNSKKNNIPS